MHVQLTFQLIIDSLFFFQTSSTKKPQHIPFKNYDNNHPSITYPSYIYHLFKQLYHHDNSNTTNSFPRTSQLILLPFYLSILVPCPLHLTFCKQHTSIIPFLSYSQTSFHSDYLKSTSILAPQGANLASLHAARYALLGCGVAPSYSW